MQHNVAMVASMTAFGRASGELAQWEIKSVNHRYLDLSFRLPDPLRGIEAALRQLTQRRVKRGKVEAALHIPAPRAPAPRLNADALARVLAAIADVRRQAAREHGKDAALGAIDPLDLMRQPGVFEDDGGDVAALKEAALDGYAAAIEDLLAQRRSEGASIAALLRDRLQQASTIVAEVRTLAARHVPTLHERLQKRVDELLNDRANGARRGGSQAGPTPDRLAQEVALLAQKADVAEELDRLGMHVAEAEASLDGDEPCGRRLDFLLQEMNREANTLAAKALLPDAARLGVELKVAIEQMREQAQNVE